MNCCGLALVSPARSPGQHASSHCRQLEHQASVPLGPLPVPWLKLREHPVRKIAQVLDGGGQADQLAFESVLVVFLMATWVHPQGCQKKNVVKEKGCDY